MKKYLACLFLFSVAVLLSAKFFISKSRQHARHARQVTTFDGVLTHDVLIGWGFHTTSTTIIRIDKREIRTIAPDAFKLFSNLASLDLSNNHLEEVKANWFNELTRLVTLDLTVCDIVTVTNRHKEA